MLGNQVKENNITLLTRREGRVEQRSAFGWVNVRNALTETSLAYLTHPVVAALDHPPFCKQKGGLRRELEITDSGGGKK